MELGFVGLGRMGMNMTIRLLRGGHQVVATTREPEKIEEVKGHGALGVATLEKIVATLEPPRAIWAMIPAGKAVEGLIDELQPLLQPGDLFVDGGNSNYRDSVRRAERFKAAGLEYVDAGVSGGIWGLEIGYCMMIGGAKQAVDRLAPALDTLAPKDGWRHVGGSGAGHFSKMIHNGIEYGMMQAYAEGFEILKASDYDYDLAKLAHLWNQGSVVRSWLLELAAKAFESDPNLDKIRGYVDDSGEGRWTVEEAINLAVPAPVLALSLFRRFRSRQDDAFSDRVLAALRAEFGGHAVKEKTS